MRLVDEIQILNFRVEKLKFETKKIEPIFCRNDDMPNEVQSNSSVG